MKRLLVFLLLAITIGLFWPEGVLVLRAKLWSVVDFYLTSDAIYLKLVIIGGIAFIVAAFNYLLWLMNRDPRELPYWVKVGISEDPAIAVKQLAALFTAMGLVGVTVEAKAMVFRVDGRKSAKVEAEFPNGKKKIVRLMDGTACLELTCIHDGGSFTEARLPGSGSPFVTLKSRVGASLCDLGQTPVRATWSEVT